MIMPGTMVCRVCGKKYEACKSEKISNTFRWQDVACSPECGAVYLYKVQVARGIIKQELPKEEPKVKDKYKSKKRTVEAIELEDESVSDTEIFN